VKIHTLDLEFRRRGTVAAYLVESGPDLALIETGPDSTWPRLRAALAGVGAKPSDVRTVLVTHIHLDHAGAAWRMAREGATVWVHPRGAAHMSDPSRLLTSAKRIYRDRMDELWGTLEPIPADRMKIAEDGMRIQVGKTEIRVVESVGHAQHHNAFLVEGNLFTGDVGGVAIGGGPVLPPTPPPDIDLEAWRETLGKFRALRPDALYPTHFGRRERTAEALDQLESELAAWAGFVREGLEAGKDEAAIVTEFEAWAAARLVAAGVDEAGLDAYLVALPFAMNVTGLARYWQKKLAA
jgi:glyoxylase-like metal-dependent hydrolase (beta-lactamase superfamily II)